MNTSLKLTALILSSMLLSGCTSLTTSYVRPEIPNAPSWAGAPGNTSPLATTNWWQSFGDNKLNTLVAKVLDNNNDLLAASIRVRRALLSAERAGVALVPTVSGSGTAQSAIPLGGGSSIDTVGLSLGASYEIDLWGRLSSEKDVARLEALAVGEDMLAARTTVIATTIETYWRLAYANQDLATAQESLAAARKTEELVRTQAEAGAASELELAEVRQTVESQAATISDLQQTRSILRNTLAVLLNGQPNPVSEPARLPGRTPVIVSAGLPASLLARRPDLRAAELRLYGALRSVDATRASLYPQISLTGNLGATSNDLLKILANPIATLGAGIVLPFLNFKDSDLRVRVSETDYELAVVQFRSTLLNAFSDVANALSSRTALAEKARRLRSALDAAIEAERLTEERYRAGTITLRVWLDAQERRRVTQRAQVTNRLEQLVTEVQIFRVLGGSPDLPPVAAR